MKKFFTAETGLMRYCLVAYTDYHSDSRVLRETEALVSKGYHVDVICLRGDKPRARVRENGVRIYPIMMGRYRGKSKTRFLFSYSKFFVSVFAMLTGFHLLKGYRIVQVNNIPDCLVFSALVPKLLGAKVILDIRDPMPEGYMVKYRSSPFSLFVRMIKKLEIWSARFADGAICVSEQHRMLLMNHGIPEDKLTVVMNLPDEKIFDCLPHHKKRTNGFEMVFHGTLAERLGVDIAIRAVDIVRHEVQDIKFNVYGGGEFLPVLERMVAELDLRGHVLLTGRFHPAREIPTLIRTADVGIVPNRKNLITDLMMPVKLMEYIALEIPVIAPRLDTIAYYFEDMVYLFDPGDPHDLASTLLEIYYNPDKAEALAKRALGFLEKYSWESEAKKYHRMIDRMTAEVR